MKLVRISKRGDFAYNKEFMVLSDVHAEYIEKSRRGVIIKDMGKVSELRERAKRALKKRGW